MATDTSSDTQTTREPVQLASEIIGATLDVCNAFKKGEATMGDIMQISQKQIDTLYSVGYNLLKAKKYDKAEKIFQLLCIFAPKTIDYWLGYSICHKMQAHWEAAIMTYYIILRIQPECCGAYLNIAECLMHIDKFAEAKKCIEVLMALVDADENLLKKPNNTITVKRAAALLISINRKLSGQ
jgi:type III secretion system low calcium response chaperone LcrH/SycD